MNSDAQELSSPVTESSLSSDEVKAVLDLIDEVVKSTSDDEGADLLGSISWIIYNYEDGTGDMPGKTEDLTNLCRFALRAFFNSVIYHFFNGDCCKGDFDRLIAALDKVPDALRISEKLFSASDFELIEFATQPRKNSS